MYATLRFSERLTPCDLGADIEQERCSWLPFCYRSLRFHLGDAGIERHRMTSQARCPRCPAEFVSLSYPTPSKYLIPRGKVWSWGLFTRHSHSFPRPRQTVRHVACFRRLAVSNQPSIGGCDYHMWLMSITQIKRPHSIQLNTRRSCIKHVWELGLPKSRKGTKLSRYAASPESSRQAHLEAHASKPYGIFFLPSRDRGREMTRKSIHGNYSHLLTNGEAYVKTVDRKLTS